MKQTRSIVLFVILGLLTACGSSAASYNNQGNRDFEAEKYEEALKNYTTAKQEDPELVEPYYNSGNLLYQEGNLESAFEQLQQSLRTDDDALAQKSFYNLGNTYFKAQDWQKAIDAYVQALLLAPGDIEAKNNLELALQNLQQQSQQQQQNQNSQQQQSQGGNQPNQQQQQQQQNQDENQDDSEGEGQEDQEQDQSGQNDPQPQEQQPGQGELTPEEAEQLLDALGQDSQTLQERLQQQFGAPSLPPVQDW